MLGKKEEAEVEQKRMLWIRLPKTIEARKSEEKRIIVAIVLKFKTERSLLPRPFRFVLLDIVLLFLFTYLSSLFSLPAFMCTLK